MLDSFRIVQVSQLWCIGSIHTFIIHHHSWPFIIMYHDSSFIPSFDSSPEVGWAALSPNSAIRSVEGEGTGHPRASGLAPMVALAPLDSRPADPNPNPPALTWNFLPLPQLNGGFINSSIQHSAGKLPVLKRQGHKFVCSTTVKKQTVMSDHEDLYTFEWTAWTS